MKETTLWQHIDHPLSSYGKVQKVSDRFTPGVPDVLGSIRRKKGKTGIPLAMELKELSGVRVLKTGFRPGQLDWLRDWEEMGGVSLILTSWGHNVMAFRWQQGCLLENGASLERVLAECLFSFPKGTRGATWRDFVSLILVPLIQRAAEGPEPYSMVSGVPVLLRPDLGPLRT